MLQIVEEEGLKHSFWMSEICQQTVLLPEQDMKQKDTGEQDIIKSQDQARAIRIGYCIGFTILKGIGFTQYYQSVL